MNKKELLSLIDEKILDDKKPQTSYKIKYVQEYAKLWTIISAQRDNIKKINFIDCMCNAGIYKDGDLGTSMEVLHLFKIYADKFPSKCFNLFLNDFNKERIESSRIIAKHILGDKIPKNLHVFFSSTDVNSYLTDTSFFDKYLSYDASTLNFVDPYNFSDVKIKSIRHFAMNYYCEIVFNLFTMDFVRNKDSLRISECLGNTREIASKDEFIEEVISQIKVNKMQYAFPYSFKNTNNAEIYQIVFFTPSKKGLEVLKEALFKVFKGLDAYRNEHTATDLFGDSLFSDDEIDEMIIKNCGIDAQNMIIKTFSPGIYHYGKLEEFLIEKTVMMDSQIIRYVLSPMIEKGSLIKKNQKGRKNYKEDYYELKG